MHIGIMLYLFLFTIFTLYFNTAKSEFTATVTCRNIEGYYWRDYKGEIPSDALVGVRGDKGASTYIGQAVYNGLVIPGKIVESEKKMYYEWAGKEIAAPDNDLVKILCTSYPENFEWIPTSDVQFKKIKDKDFVLGGYEPDHKTYIGRSLLSNGQRTVGKVQVRPSDLNAVLHTTTNDHAGAAHVEFEVLVYNSPTANSINVNVINSNSQCKQLNINFYS